MKLTILKTGQPPAHLTDRYPSYPDMFRAMLAREGLDIDYEEVDVVGGAPLPEADDIEAALITGSPAGVYEDHAWLEPLREFIREAYAREIKLVGVCFGHQIIADALGGEVRKSEKGWGLGRHTYQVVERPEYFDEGATSISVACSHQDQVIVAPKEARVLLASDFTPNAGLIYANGATLTMQPHPEFDDDYAGALVSLREGLAPDAVTSAAHGSFEKPSDSRVLSGAIARFLAG